MEIEALSSPYLWDPEDAASMQLLGHDWYGRAIEPPARFRLVEDPDRLWLVAAREVPAKPHPTALCGDFQAGLWQHDVAELFVAAPGQSNYLEFNLSPAGAWWMEHFAAPRQAAPLEERPAVRTFSHAAPSCWRAALGIPLDWLRSAIGWGEESALNVTLILDSPHQRFLTASSLGDGEPDFHRPGKFPKVTRKARHAG